MSLHHSRLRIRHAVACSQGSADPVSNEAGATPTATGRSGGDGWIANGATACEKYLTPDVVAEILDHPAGHIEKRGSQACAYVTDDGGGILIMLVNGGPSVFDAHQSYLVNPLPLPGVGDKASRSVLGIEAVKGQDRMCTIHTSGAPGLNKLSGEPLARKLGEICNKLLAMP